MYKYLIIRFKEYIFIILTATIFFLSTIVNCKAEQNVFTVDNVEIKAEMNLNFSRKQYIDIALLNSFEMLMSKILLAKDLKRVNNTELKKIKNLINSFQIVTETYRNNIYEAKFNIFYSSLKVKKFLGKKNISFTQPKQISAVFFPLLLINDEIIPLEQNFFYKDWLNTSIKNELINFILPLEDLEDVLKLSNLNNKIEDINVEDFVNKYEVKNYVFALANYQNKKLNIYLKMNFNNNKTSKNISYEIHNINDKEKSNIILEDLKLLITDFWKRENVISLTSPLTLKIKYKYKNLRELDKLKKSFYKISIIDNYSLDELSTKNSIIKIYYYGNPKKLKEEFKNLGYKLENNNGSWEIYKYE